MRLFALSGAQVLRNSQRKANIQNWPINQQRMRMSLLSLSMRI